MHQIHTGRAPQYLADSLESIAESSRRPGLRSADYIKRRSRTKFDERSFSHAGPAAWNSLPDNIKLTVTTDTKSLIKSYLFIYLAFWHFVSAHRQPIGLSSALQICRPICNCNYYYHLARNCLRADCHRPGSAPCPTLVSSRPMGECPTQTLKVSQLCLP